MIDVGATVPDFELTSTSGETVRLSDFRGQRVVLYFYPQDDTPGCTAQACSFRDQYARFADDDVVVIGVSPDDVDSHSRFTEKYRLPFTLLSDPGHRVAQLFGATIEENQADQHNVETGRATFVIDASGVVVAALPDVTPDGHADEVLTQLA